MTFVKTKNMEIIDECNNCIKEYSELYGDENTSWDIDDLDNLRQIGQEFMVIFANYFEDK